MFSARLPSCRALLECWTRLRNAYGFPHASHSWTQLAAKDWIPWWVEMGSGLTLFLWGNFFKIVETQTKNMNQMFRYKGGIEKLDAMYQQKVYLWILTKRTVAMMFKKFMTSQICKQICSVYMLWTYPFWTQAFTVYQRRIHPAHHYDGMILPMNNFLGDFKSHNPNTSTSHIFVKDRVKHVAFFEVDVKLMICQRFQLLDFSHRSCTPRVWWECLCTAANRSPIHTWQLHWLISTVPRSWFETRTLVYKWLL